MRGIEKILRGLPFMRAQCEVCDRRIARPEREWGLVLLLGAIFFAGAMGVGGYFFLLLEKDVTGADGVLPPTPSSFDREALEAVAEEIRIEQKRYEQNKRRPPDVVDPSR